VHAEQVRAEVLDAGAVHFAEAPGDEALERRTLIGEILNLNRKHGPRS
jgi:hypothetical protein